MANSGITRKEKIVIAITVPLLVLVLVGEIAWFVNKQNNNYEKCCNNPPTYNWIEEDLERVFWTTNVMVYDDDEEENHILYTVGANGFYYKVHYAISGSFMSYHWKYQGHILINWEPDNL